jgi:hypothetical protein
MQIRLKGMWFVPWVSALIVTASLMLIGMLLGGTVMLVVKKGAEEARKHLRSVQGDMPPCSMNS